MRNTFAMAGVAITLMQYYRIRDFGEFGTQKSKQFLKERKVLIKSILSLEPFSKDISLQ